MHEYNAENFPRRIEKNGFLHVSMFFYTSQIEDGSMNDVTSTHIWEITSCPELEFNDVTKCFNRKHATCLCFRHAVASIAKEVRKVTNLTKYFFLRVSIDFQNKLRLSNHRDVSFRVAYFTCKDASDPFQRTARRSRGGRRRDPRLRRRDGDRSPAR